jgi:hypothetical protein
LVGSKQPLVARGRGRRRAGWIQAHPVVRDDDPNNFEISKGRLYTGAFYANGVYVVFKWVWNGRGFHPVYVSDKHN